MLHVTCAIIEHCGQVLICQRSKRMKLPLKWEFPGGKVEKGESKEECLIREVKEELGLEIKVGRALRTVEYHYPDLSLCLYPFVCSMAGGELHATEHAQVIWIEPSGLMDYDWAAADVPVAKEYLGNIVQKPNL